MRLLASMLLAAATLTSGCATAVRGTTEPVTFVSDPAGAKMDTSTGLSCVTPCTLEIPRSDTFTATFTLEDQTETVFVDTEISEAAGATTAANILLTPIIAIPVAIAVDASSGANLDHTPNPVVVSFKNDASVEAAPAKTEDAANLSPDPEKASVATPLSASGLTHSDTAPKTDRLSVSVSLDVDNSVYTFCSGVTQRIPEQALSEETPAWHDLEYRQAPGLNLKARIRPSGDAVVVDVWPHSDTWRESDVITVSLSSLEPGASGRSFSTKPLELDGFHQCGPFVVYAAVESAG